MKNKFVSFCVIGFVAVCACALHNSFVYALPENNYNTISSSAKAMCVLEQSSGRVLFGKDIDKKLPMASTTKIFTALTVLDNCKNLEEQVSVDDSAIGIEGTSIYLRKGECLSVKELLLGMMLPSGNDAATALAYHIGGDVETFAKMMQVSAQNAGAKNSSFKNPHGLDEDGHYTTAYDLAKVTAKALENETFYEISTTKSAIISGNSEVKSRYLRNKNKLLKTYDGCNGVKTGFTDNAGRCFVSSAKRENMTIVCSVLNCPDMFEECARLMDKAFTEFELVDILPNYSVLKDVNVEKGREDSVKVFSRNGFSYPLNEGEKLKITVENTVPNSLVAPIKKEQRVGKINVYLDGKLLFSDDVLTREEVRKNDVVSYFWDILHNWK